MLLEPGSPHRGGGQSEMGPVSSKHTKGFRSVGAQIRKQPVLPGPGPGVREELLERG